MNATYDNMNLLKKARQGDKNAEEQLIQDNLGLVHSAVRRLISSQFEYDDLFQAGCIGLLKAARCFDLERGVMFSTYAFPVIAGEIKRHIRDDGPIKVGRHLKEVSLRSIKTKERLNAQLGREPTIREIAAETMDSVDDIIMAFDAVVTPLSLDEPTSSEDRDSVLGDFIGVDKSEQITEIFALKEEIGNLPPLERQIIGLRFLKGKTQQQTAKILQMTQVQISRKEKKIIELLRKAL